MSFAPSPYAASIATQVLRDMPHLAQGEKQFLDSQWLIREEYPGDPRTGSLGDVFGWGGTQRPGESLPRSNPGRLPNPPVFGNLPSPPDLDWPEWGDPLFTPPTINDPPPASDPPQGPPDLPPPGGVVVVPPGVIVFPPFIIIDDDDPGSSSSGSSGSSGSDSSGSSSGSGSSSSTVITP